jgi:hypothetical protein
MSEEGRIWETDGKVLDRIYRIFQDKEERREIILTWQS